MPASDERVQLVAEALKEMRKPSAQEVFTRARMHRNEMATDLANAVLRHHLEGFIYPPIIQGQIDAYFRAVSKYRTAKDAL